MGKNILSFISTWLRFSHTCHKGCLNTWLGDRKLREAKLRCFFKASKTVASPGRWLMWCTAKTLRCSVPSRLTLERPKNVIIPTPPHPNPMTCVAPTMCASARNMMLRSNDHVCKCKERYHPHPTPTPPHPMTCVAPTMCASARNVTIPTPPHPNPTPTPPQLHIYKPPRGRSSRWTPGP